MSDVNYSPDSPYYNTQVRGEFLDVLSYRNIPQQRDDVLHTLTQVHEYRPDLLAYDLYKNSNLWWVFMVRNPNVFKDPIWDFRAGTKFYIPKQTTVEQALGL